MDVASCDILTQVGVLIRLLLSPGKLCKNICFWLAGLVLINKLLTEVNSMFIFEK